MARLARLRSSVGAKSTHLPRRLKPDPTSVPGNIPDDCTNFPGATAAPVRAQSVGIATNGGDDLVQRPQPSVRVRNLAAHTSVHLTEHGLEQLTGVSVG